MVGASSGRLDHIGRLNFSRDQGLKVNIGEQSEFRLEQVASRFLCTVLHQ